MPSTISCPSRRVRMRPSPLSLPPSKLKLMSCLVTLAPLTLSRTLYDDLECMALIRSLPPEYDPLTRPLLVSKDLSTQKVREAYHAEESQACS
ncbi:hypothetical protein L218DRAFT_1041256, partial [Marasmius fiardii PR-910]